VGAQVSTPQYRAAQRPLFLDSLSPPVAVSATSMATNGIGRSQLQRSMYSHEKSASPQAPTQAFDRPAENPPTSWMPLVWKFVALTVLCLCCMFLVEALAAPLVEQDPEQQTESSATSTPTVQKMQATDANGTAAPAESRATTLGPTGDEDLGRIPTVEDLVSLTILVPSLVYLTRSCFTVNDPRPRN
jgi:hypothetical protein